MLVPVAPGVVRFAPPSSSSSPNVDGVGSWGKLQSVFCGVCVAGCCSKLVLAWVAWVGYVMLLKQLWQEQIFRL